VDRDRKILRSYLVGSPDSALDRTLCPVTPVADGQGVRKGDALSAASARALGTRATRW
jgi:hypothetical protein